MGIGRAFSPIVLTLKRLGVNLRARNFLLFAAVLGGAGCSQDVAGGGDLLVVTVLEVLPTSADLMVGATQQFSAVARTASGITVPNRTVAWSSSDPSVLTVSASGLATGISAGAAMVRARIDAAAVDVPVTVSPVPIAQVTVEPDAATILVGDTLRLTATPRDSEGQPLADRTIVFTSGNPAIATVASSGTVTGFAPGSTTITATAEGKSGGSRITVNPRPAVGLGFVAQPVNGTAGQPLPPIRIAVQDDRGGTVTGASGAITIALAANPGNAALSGTLTVSAVSGVATFSDLVLNRTGSGYTLRGTSGELTPATSTQLDIGPGAAAEVVIVQQPASSVQNGAVLAQQPVVQLRDALGNVVTRSGQEVQAGLSPSGATLDGNLTALTTNAGMASFDGLRITGAVGTYRLTFLIPGAPAAQSNEIVVSAGPAARLVIVTQPSATVQSGDPFPQQPRIQVTDQSGNPVAGNGLTVTAALASGPGALSGGQTATTGSTGLAAFATLGITGPLGSYTIRFTSQGLGDVVSNTVTVTSGPPTQLGITQQPSATAQSGVVFATQPTVQLRDADGNAVARAGVEVTAAIVSGGGTLGGTRMVSTNASGQAVFTNLSITGIIGDRTLRFSAASLESATSSAIAVGPGLAERLILTQQPSATATSGSPFARQPVVQVVDGAGNNVPSAGRVVSASIASGSAVTLTGPNGASAVTDATGRAAFSGLTLTGSTGEVTLRFATPGLTPVISATITLAPLVSRLVMVRQPSDNVDSGDELGSQPRVLALDSFDDPVSGVQITATISAGATLEGDITKITNSEGLAIFNDLRIIAPEGTYTLTFTGEGKSVTSDPIRVEEDASLSAEDPAGERWSKLRPRRVHALSLRW